MVKIPKNGVNISLFLCIFVRIFQKHTLKYKKYTLNILNFKSLTLKTHDIYLKILQIVI